MATLLLLSLMLNFISLTAAQYTITNPPSPEPTVITPAMSSASVSSAFAALVTGTIQQQGGEAGDASSSNGTSASANAAGASGSDNESFTLSKGGLIAIVVVVSLVVIFGITSSVLFYLAKKRSWQVRATIRKSARRVATALTPRRSEFPKDVQNMGRNTKGATRIDDVPPTPRIRSHDLEKANSKLTEFEMKEPAKPSSKWGRKTDR